MTAKTVLITEDDPTNLSIMQDLLLMQGVSPITAKLLQEAKTKIHEGSHLDLAILDVNLPDGLGTTLIPLLKEKYPAIGIFVVSSIEHHELAALIGENTIDMFLQKPFEPQHFVQEVTKRLSA